MAADETGERAGPVTEGCLNQCREFGETEGQWGAIEGYNAPGNMIRFIFKWTVSGFFHKPLATPVFPIPAFVPLMAAVSVCLLRARTGSARP